MYLPLVAMKHGYAFDIGEKTFTLTQITIRNDPFTILERHLKPLETGEKEILLSCNNIDRELGWPKGLAKMLLLNMPLRNINFEIELKDMGSDKIRIICKK